MGIEQGSASGGAARNFSAKKGDYWLQTARMARKAGANQTAYRALLHADKYSPALLHVERAKIRMWGLPLVGLRTLPVWIFFSFLRKLSRLCGRRDYCKPLGKLYSILLVSMQFPMPYRSRECSMIGTLP